ncbi:MAG: MFS transporter [Clostridia bacterium]|nr:MFS transporter [Clostridia bacterium]
MKLNYKRTFLIGLAFMTISGFWQLYNNAVPLMLKNTFEVSDTVSGVVMAADNVLAVFLLPLFGAISDRVQTPIGKRMPFIVGGSLAAALLMMLIPIANLRRSLWLFVAALAVLLVVMGTYRSPAVALMPDVTPKPLRSKGNAIINLMGALGGIVTYLVITVVVKLIPAFDTAYTVIFGIVAAFMVAAAIILLLTVKENRFVAELPEEKEDDSVISLSNEIMPTEVRTSLIFLLLSVFFWFMAYNAVETAYSRYVQEVWGKDQSVGGTMMIIAMLVATAAYLPVGMLSSKFGRKKVILCGVTLLAVAFAAGFAMPGYSIIAYVIMGVIGIGWAAINVNSYPMVVEMSKGSDIGRYTGLYYTFSMAAQITTPILSGLLFDLLPWGYRVMFPYALGFSALAFLTMLNVNHGDNRPDAKGIEVFDVDD